MPARLAAEGRGPFDLIFMPGGDLLVASADPWLARLAADGGKLVIAAYGDSTIRWHRMTDGVELLAFMPLPNQTDWVAWTPEGFYAATAGAQGVLRSHVTRLGRRRRQRTDRRHPDSDRPEVLPFVPPSRGRIILATIG